MHTLMHHPLMEKLRHRSLPHVGLLVLRVLTGAVFVYHGYPKLFGGTEKAVMFFSNIGIPLPGFFAPFVGVVEFFGGILLILGLGTRVMGLAYIVNMAVAILAAKGLSSWRAMELELLLLANGLLLLLNGAGEYSLDAWLMERSKKAHDSAMPMKQG